MSRKVTIVMYHYVRELERSRFPAIKGLRLDRFRRQLEHIKANYTPVAVEDLMDASLDAGVRLPPNAILLTFDDGYSDHFQNVFPLLDAAGIRGCFYPSAQPVRDHMVMDVNKIQFVLAAARDVEKLLDQAFHYLDEFRSEFELKSREEYRQSVTEKHRYDPPEVILFKRLLQRELPETVRRNVVRRLFADYVTSDEAAFACELYMSIDQMSCMRAHGMHIGSHGDTHVWLNHIGPDAQADEVDRSLDFLEKLGIDKNEWTICYPYGGFDESLLKVIRARRCRMGFSVEPRAADLDLDDPLTLPRIDTNDLPS